MIERIILKDDELAAVSSGGVIIALISKETDPSKILSTICKRAMHLDIYTQAAGMISNPSIVSKGCRPFVVRLHDADADPVAEVTYVVSVIRRDSFDQEDIDSLII